MKRWFELSKRDKEFAILMTAFALTAIPLIVLLTWFLEKVV